MDIRKIDVGFLKKDGFNTQGCEGRKHVKVLPYLSVVQSAEGSYDITLGNREQRQTGDGGFFIAPSGIQQTIVHHINSESGRMVCRWIFIDVKINGRYRLDSVFRFPEILTRDEAKELNACFDALFSTDDVCEEYSIVYRIIGYLLKKADMSASDMPEAIERAVEYIIKHYEERITVGDLARIATMSESNFYASFKRYIGVAPITYLNNYRLSLAAEMLCDSDEPIGEIGYAVGIKDALYFSKLFKRTYGITPQNYRRSNSRF